MTDASKRCDLHSLLTSDGRQLENIKFFPGTDKTVTADDILAQAKAAISAAFEEGLIDTPPVSEVPQFAF